MSYFFNSYYHLPAYISRQHFRHFMVVGTLYTKQILDYPIMYHVLHYCSKVFNIFKTLIHLCIYLIKIHSCDGKADFSKNVVKLCTALYELFHN